MRKVMVNSESCVSSRRPSQGGSEPYGSFYFACDHSKLRNTKRHNCGCNVVLFLPSLSQKLHPNSYNLANKTSVYNVITQNNEDTPTSPRCVTLPASSMRTRPRAAQTSHRDAERVGGTERLVFQWP